MPMMYGYTWSWGAVLFMVVNALFWFALIGAFIWVIFQWADRRARIDTGPSQTTARDILQQRYARGEIDAQTYEEMLARLDERTPITTGPRS